MSERFKVVEIEMVPPHRRRVMAVDMNQGEADVFVRLAVMRRGVETHFYNIEPFDADAESPNAIND